MLILPAIDLKDGKCVRLRQGRAEQSTVYGDDPVAMARRWEAEGARYLHVVDLDGAFGGRPAHARVIERIVNAIAIPVEVGGGLRSDDAIRRVLEAGAARAIVGTRAVQGGGTLVALAERFGERLAVGIDARDGYVQVDGWVKTTRIRAGELGARAAQAGVGVVIYTDTAQDGMLSGPNLEAMAAMCAAADCSVIASGGISSAADIEALAGLGCGNLAGAIVGKALYDGRTTLRELQRAAGTARR
jgi:phosphoribosylformimino-5-aminoimidazole carboxamide ribotide isomerase